MEEFKKVLKEFKKKKNTFYFHSKIRKKEYFPSSDSRTRVGGLWASDTFKCLITLGFIVLHIISV